MTEPGERNRAFLLLLFMPLFFSTNIIFGRAAVQEVEPFTLAFLRWAFTALILLPFVLPAVRQNRELIRSMPLAFLNMGFFGMWICGALVYLALKFTTATNGTLIYASAPIMIILIEWLFRGRALQLRETMGVALALVGIVIIVVQGSVAKLLQLQFNPGDLIFVGTAISWAIYSLALKSERFAPLQTLPLFMLIAASGAILLAPFSAFEIIWLGTFPHTVSAWANILGIVLIASLLAFGTFQYGVKILGASTTGIFLYLLPIYGVSLAVLLLGEQLAIYHAYGIVLVLSGVALATWPKQSTDILKSGKRLQEEESETLHSSRQE